VARAAQACVRGAGTAMIAGLAAVVASGCGRKGPPLPPLVRLPAAPPEFTAERRGDTVEISFVIPGANTDGTRPANIERVDVYGYTGPPDAPDAELVARGSRIASVDVQAPSDPNRTIDPDEPASDLEPLEGPGLPQGDSTQVHEQLGAAITRTAASADGTAPGRPLVGAPRPTPRSYIGVGVSTSGRTGPFSKRALVPLGPAPAPPSMPSVTYDESGVTVTWSPAASEDPGADLASAGVLPSTPFGPSVEPVSYHVYDVRRTSASVSGSTGEPSSDVEVRLTGQAIAERRYVDSRVEWGAERCYRVRAVLMVDGLGVESEPTPPVCATLVDTFPPRPPDGLVAVSSERAVNLIWNPSGAADLAGYLVLRRSAPTGMMELVTPKPILETTFTDRVDSGLTFVYAVQAVDQAGNRSAPSEETAPETAR
jgi:hypothetical protein